MSFLFQSFCEMCKDYAWQALSREMKTRNWLARNFSREIRCEKCEKFVGINLSNVTNFPPILWTRLINFHPKKEKKFSCIVELLIISSHLIRVDYNAHQFIVIGDTEQELKHFCWSKFWISCLVSYFSEQT